MIPTWDLMATAQSVNFDKLLSGTDKMIYVLPPENKTWVILQASFSIEVEHPELSIHVWLDFAPYAPYRDEVTGEMVGCPKCVDLVRGDLLTNFWPIVGGYADTGLHGQSMPIVIKHPNRLNIAVSPAHGGLEAPLQTYTRLLVIER